MRHSIEIREDSSTRRQMFWRQVQSFRSTRSVLPRQHKYTLWNELCAQISCTKGPDESKAGRPI